MADNNRLLPDSDDLRDDERMDKPDAVVPRLDEDNDTPFSPATSPVDAAGGLDGREQGGKLDPTNQLTDVATDIDSQQLYDEGLAGAAEADESNGGNAVTSFNKPGKDAPN